MGRVDIDAIPASFQKLSFDPTTTDLLVTSQGWFGSILNLCEQDPLPESVPQFGPHLEAMRADLVKLSNYLDTVDADNYKIDTLSKVQILDQNILKISLRETIFTKMGFWKKLPNSSTNHNRKRGAYVLKRFFCDDLTPVNIESPSSHAEGKHGSEPACQACHYKLDPISGFFRTIGAEGVDYRGKEEIYFDDFATVDLNEYINSWRSVGNQTRPWHIGYIRSISDDTLNDFSDHTGDPTLEDMLAIIVRAPESSKCLVKNMYRYFVGEHFMLDAGYLEYLTENFISMKEENSSYAFKETLKLLLQGSAFSQRDPGFDSCYDFRPGIDPEGLPPCSVSFILQKNCSSCHSGKSSAGGLDLASWQTGPNGSGRFPHSNQGGQIPAEVSFQSIADRLTTDDGNLRMPLGIHMPNEEREALYLWSLEMLESRTKLKVR